MYSKNSFILDLENSIAEGFAVDKISKVAFEIYQNRGLEISDSMDRILLTLMAMTEGEEFQLTENEFLDLISELRRDP